MKTRRSPEGVVLYLEGSEAQRGLPLTNLEAFVDAFVVALRDFDRTRRAEPTRPMGHPTKRAELVAALRLVEFKPGSAQLTLEPILEAVEPDDEMFEGEYTLALSNLYDLVEHLEAEDPLDEHVSGALRRATKALGRDGKIAIDVKSGRRRRKTVIDETRLDRVERAREERSATRTVSGRLHKLDLEPDVVGIRTPQGVEWTCRYPADLEQAVMELIGSVVWVRGRGHQASARTGQLDIETIQRADQGTQQELFSAEPVDVAELAAEQGVEGPQGLDALVDPFAGDDTEDELYLKATLGDLS